ncbi:MAG: helix-turn-helix transcriptional regulator [Capnocytophaga sp.]|nr:helix-turn-helix transcriptional regulator [Capnocytophaga sp.]
MNTVKAFIERSAGGFYSVYVDLKDATLNYGIHGEGLSVEEAKEDFLLSYEDMKKIYAEENKPFTEADFVFQYDTASFLAYYNQFLSLVGLSKLTGINKSQLSHYIQGVRNPGPATTVKIQSALYKFADELKSIRLS